MPLAILSGRFAQEGEGEEEGTADGDAVDRLVVAAGATTASAAASTAASSAEPATGRAYEPLRVTGDEGTRAPALTCPIAGVKRPVATRTNERFLRNEFYKRRSTAGSRPTLDLVYPVVA